MVNNYLTAAARRPILEASALKRAAADPAIYVWVETEWPVAVRYLQSVGISNFDGQGRGAGCA